MGACQSCRAALDMGIAPIPAFPCGQGKECICDDCASAAIASNFNIPLEPNGAYLGAFESPVRRMGASKGNRKQCLPGEGRGPSFAQVTAQFKLGPGLRRGDR